MDQKDHVIEQIRQRNQSATPEYLVHFNEKALQDYLRRLTHVNGHRGPDSVWVRQTGRPAVSTRLPV